MKITGSRKEIELIQSLCDIALKASGIASLNGVGLILNSVEVTDEDGKTIMGHTEEERATEKKN